jgi:hypothetical protein
MIEVSVFSMMSFIFWRLQGYCRANTIATIYEMMIESTD